MSAIAPITGKLRKQLFTDLGVSLGLGIAAGYYFWYGIHLPAAKKRDVFYAKLEAQKLEESA
ncbi:Cytochrome c oxidase subunit 7A [Vanrija albida]|uniref:Cytochrome c oxidase subunit 9, mitochondrial n=1 Tax=Vanrija albida TaxID=181172 RepID=A0ABR3Q310_9TREE